MIVLSVLTLPNLHTSLQNFAKNSLIYFEHIIDEYLKCASTQHLTLHHNTPLENAPDESTQKMGLN